MHKNTKRVLPVLLTAILLASCSPKLSDTALLESGKQFLAKKDYSRAVLQFRSAVRANPKNVDAQYQLALAESGRGDQIAAYRALTKTLSLNPQHTDAHLKLAALLVTSSLAMHLEEAQEHAQVVLDASPGHLGALDTMAIADLRLGKRAEAVELLDQANKQAPEHLQTAALLASTRLGQRDPAGAEQILKRAVEQSETLHGHVVLGSFYFLTGKNQDAERQFRKVLDKDPNNVLALVGLSAMVDSVGRKDEAEQMYHRLANQPKSSYQHLYGSYLFRRGKKTESVKEFERLAQLNSKDVDARTRLVAAYIATNRLADAHKILMAALAKNSKEPRALMQKSELSMIAGAYEDARQDLSTVLHYTPESAVAHFLLAGVYRAERNPLRQRHELTETLRLDPRFFTARAALNQIYIAAGDTRSAVDLMNGTPVEQKDSLGYIENRNWAALAAGDLKGLQSGITEGLAKAQTRNLMMQDALLKLQQGKVAAAQARLTEILKKYPEDRGTVSILVGSYAGQKKLPEAIAKVQALLSERPNSVMLRYQLGVLLATNDQPKDARTVFAATTAASPQFAPAKLALAMLDRNAGQSDAARKELEPLLSSGAAVPARMQLGFIEAKSGNYANAIEHFRKVIEAEPKNVVALNNLAYLLANHASRSEEALKYAQTAKELAPNDVNVAGTIGWVFYQRGLYVRAVQQLQEAVNREGRGTNDGTAVRQYHLAMAYMKIGDDAQAAKTLSAALKLNPNLPEAEAAMRMINPSR